MDDFFEPITGDELEAVKKQLRDEMVHKLINKQKPIEFKDMPEFIEAFQKTKNYRLSIDDPDVEVMSTWLYAAYCGNGRLVACNTHRLIEIGTGIPSTLEGRYIVDITDHKAWVLEEPEKSPLIGKYQDVQDILSAVSDHTFTLTRAEIESFVKETNKFDYAGLALELRFILFNKKYLHDALNVFEPEQEITLTFNVTSQKEGSQGIKLQAEGITVYVLPIQDDGEWKKRLEEATASQESAQKWVKEAVR
ncbi:MAG: hypothetical protein ACYCX4_03820 [Bacillota bacterium]